MYLHFLALPQSEYQGQFTLVENTTQHNNWAYNCHTNDEFDFHFFHSIPNVEDSSMAKRSFSRRTLAEGYGGKSNRLKQVCAL